MNLWVLSNTQTPSLRCLNFPSPTLIFFPPFICINYKNLSLFITDPTPTNFIIPYTCRLLVVSIIHSVDINTVKNMYSVFQRSNKIWKIFKVKAISSILVNLNVKMMYIIIFIVLKSLKLFWINMFFIRTLNPSTYY